MMAGKYKPETHRQFFANNRHRMQYARYQRKLKEKKATKERKAEKSLKQREQTHARRVAEVERINRVAKARIREIKRNPSQLGINMLYSMIADKRLDAVIRIDAAELVLAIGAGAQLKPTTRKARDPYAR